MCLWVAGKGEMTEQGSYNPKVISDSLPWGRKSVMPGILLAVGFAAGKLLR